MSNTDEPTPTPRKRATSLDPAAEHELEFRESEGVPIAPQSAPLQRAWHRRSTDPPATPEELAIEAAQRPPLTDPADSFSPEGPLEIEWMDENRQPAEGKIFAEPAPEPPLQAFEIIALQTSQATDQDSEIQDRPSQAPATTRPAPAPLVVRIFWAFLPMLLCIGGFASIVFTQSGIGYAWDEAYYYEPSMLAADWLTDALRGRPVFDQASIEEAFSPIHEHPDLPKFLMGIAIRCFKDPTMHLFAMRLPSAVMFGLALCLLYLLSRRAFGPVPGFVGVLLFWLSPRVFGHAHFAALEMPLICMTLLVVFCFLRGLDSRLWALFTGLSFGLLLGTKINGFFLPIPLILWAHLYARTRYVNNLFAMLTLGPLTMLAVWPWLWHESAFRFLEYLAFHLNHQQTALFYQSRTWGFGGPNAPWYYPLDILHATLPLSVLFFVILGTVRVLVRVHRSPYGALFLLCALVPLVVACLPSTPRYDGERLFLPLFPFLALLGAGGFASLVSRVEMLLETRRIRSSRGSHVFGRWIAVTLALAIMLEGATAIARYRPHLLSYFNPLVGGLRGAAALGYEVTYWGEALNEEMLAALNELPDGSKVKVLALHTLCLRHLQQWGVLNASLQFEAKAPYDYHLLLMRRGFFHRPERALADTEKFQPVAGIEFKGVRLIELYQTGPAFEAFWPAMAQIPPGMPYTYPH